MTRKGFFDKATYFTGEGDLTMSKVFQAHLDLLAEECSPEYESAEEPNQELINFMSDDINKPAHYSASSIEPIDVIEAWELPYHLGNVIKYIARHRHKGSEIKDLKKAAWYLNRHINKSKELP